MKNSEIMKDLKFTKEKDYLKNKINKLKRYTTKQEREALLLDDEDYSEYLRVLSDINPLNETEAMLLLFKLREISVSDLIELTITCSECQMMYPTSFEIDELFNFENDFGIPKGVFESVDEIIEPEVSDDMLLKDYLEIEKLIKKQNETIFKPYIKRNCVKCKKENTVFIDSKQSISKSNATNIYKEYVDISFYTHNTKLDIDSMYPFEREIYINLINQKLKENPQL